MTLRVGALALEPARIASSPEGAAEIYVHGSVVICVAHGRIQASAAHALIEVLDGHVQGRPITVFHDWEAVVGYESGARVRLTDWSTSAPPGTLGEVHVLFRSRLVAIGVATAALALRVMGLSITSHSARDTFSAALSTALARPS